MSDNFYQLYFDPKSAPVVFRQPQNLHNRYKISLIGAAGVGKSCLLARFVDGHYPASAMCESGSSHASTSSKMSTSSTSNEDDTTEMVPRETSNDCDFDDQYDCRTVDWTMPRDKQKFKIDFVDIRADANVNDNTFMRDSCAVMLVYSVADKASFAHVDTMLRQLRRLVPPDCDVIILGNQCDVPAATRAVPLAEADAYAERHGCSLFEVSAKTGVNCVEAVNELIYKWLERRAASQQHQQQQQQQQQQNRTSLHEDAVEKPLGIGGSLQQTFCAWRCI